MSAAIEVEVDRDEQDELESGYGDELESSSDSLRSSILRYEWKNERRYHNYNAGSYNYPNDESEQERLDMVHHAFRRLLEYRLFLAPIKPNGLKILDIGTGTGIWPIELASEYPGADVIGLDLSPIQPTWVPPNLRFYVEDIEQDWDEKDKYDYIHCRYMAGSIQDWPRLFRRIFDSLKPGGWAEFQESINTPYSDEDTLKNDNALVQLMDGLKKAHAKIGRSMDPAPCFKTWAVETGFAQVTERCFKLPIGPWPKDERLKEVGACMRASIWDGVEAFTNKPFEDFLSWSREEIEVLNMQVRQAVLRKDVHALFNFIVVIGQKPKQDK